VVNVADDNDFELFGGRGGSVLHVRT
jgi:hypothetical protein